MLESSATQILEWNDNLFWDLFVSSERYSSPCGNSNVGSQVSEVGGWKRGGFATLQVNTVVSRRLDGRSVSTVEAGRQKVAG